MEENKKIEENKTSSEPKNNSNKTGIIVGCIVGGIVLVIFIILTIIAVSTKIFVSNIDDYDDGDDWNYVYDKNEIDDYPSNTGGKIYTQIGFKDDRSGVIAFKGIVPKGWTGLIKSNWGVVSSTCPGVETVTLESPDRKAKIVIESQQAFVENSQYSEGINYDYYTTYMHYMDGDTFVQYYMDQMYGTDATLIKDFPDDEDVLKAANDYTKLMINDANVNNSWINSGGWGLNYSVSAVPASMSKRQYKLRDNEDLTNNKYLEASCVIVAGDSILESQYVAASKSRAWDIPYSIIYYADDKEAFDEYYEDYNFIVANSSFTTDFYAMVEYVASCIKNSYAEYYNAKAQAALQATNDYINSNYSSDSSKSTNDRVMEMWDDYINEVDEYTTLDGTKIKTSMHNDVVAQNGDSIYVGSKAGIPLGYTQLDKTSVSDY